MPPEVRCDVKGIVDHGRCGSKNMGNWSEPQCARGPRSEHTEELAIVLTSCFPFRNYIGRRQKEPILGNRECGSNHGDFS